MAPAKFERIISVSSEDPAFPAENLIQTPYDGKKWKCKTAGEKQISVVIQLEKAERITAVDVGNYGSAFIEIFVSKSNNPDDFKVLIVASSLMTLNESKLGINLSNVRFFKEDNIDKIVASEKWDRVKIVCSQPYNKLIQYGLAFLVIHTASPAITEKQTTSLGNFQLKNNESANDITIGSLFAKRKESIMGETKGAAAIRVASKEGLVEKKISPKLDSRSKESSKVSTNASTPQGLPALRNLPKDKNNAQSPKPQPRNNLNGASRESIPSPKRPKGTPTTLRKPRCEKKFDKLFENVVFAISGFQNPLRGEIRSKALQMGAKYRADWDNSCTHLVMAICGAASSSKNKLARCAFPNTPKFNQVLGHGKIVKKNWIEDCYSRRMRLPWRRYALHPPDTKKPESEDEIFEYIERPTSPVDNRRRISPGRSPSPDTDEEVEKVLKRQRALTIGNGESPTVPDSSVQINGKGRGSNEEGETDANSDNTTEMDIDIVTEMANNDTLPKNKTMSPKIGDNKKKLSLFDIKKEEPETEIEKNRMPKAKPIEHAKDQPEISQEKGSTPKGKPILNSRKEGHETRSEKNRCPKVKPILDNKRSVTNLKEKMSPVKKKPKAPKILSASASEDTYDLDTEEEDESSDSKVFDLPLLSTFFDGVSFYISGDLAEVDYNEIRRYILAHKGSVVQEDDLNDKDVKYFIAVSTDEVNKVKAIKPEIIAVRPEWIWKAHDECRIPPTTLFEVK